MHKISACIQTTTIQLKSSSLFNQRSISAVAVFFNEIGYRGKIAIATRLILNEFFSLSFLAHQIYTKGFIPGPFVVDFETDLIFFAKRCNSLLQSLMKSDHAIYFNPPIFSRWIWDFSFNLPVIAFKKLSLSLSLILKCTLETSTSFDFGCRSLARATRPQPLESWYSNFFCLGLLF